MSDLRFHTKFAFGAGQVGEGLKNAAYGTFLLFYYTQVIGLEPALGGLAIGISIAFDAVTDPLAGQISDNFKSRWGRRHPFMYVSALPLAVTFFFTFAPPQDIGQFGWFGDAFSFSGQQWEIFGWLLAFTILTRLSLTLYHVPHLALGAELTTDYAERTSIVSWRTVMGRIGGLAGSSFGLLYYFNQEELADGTIIDHRFDFSAYPEYALILAIGIFVTIWYSAAGTHSRIPELPKISDSQAARGLKDAFTDIWAALHNRSFASIFIGVIIIFVMVGVEGSLGFYMSTYFWEFSSTEIFYLMVAGALGAFLGATVTRLTNEWLDKRRTVIYGTLWWSILQLAPVCLRLIGWFPENGTTSVIVVLVLVTFISSLGVIQAVITVGSMMADIADEHEFNTERRQEGIFFGALSFSGKGASSIGSVVAGFGLQIIDFPTKAQVGQVSEDVIFNLGVFYGPVVAVLAFIAVYCYTRYRLTRERHAEILVELERRRAATATGG